MVRVGDGRLGFDFCCSARNVVFDICGGHDDWWRCERQERERQISEAVAYDLIFGLSGDGRGTTHKRNAV